MAAWLWRAQSHGHPCAGLHRAFGSLNLTRVKLLGVGESFKKHLDYESKGIKAHFNMDESGVLSLDRVSAAPCLAPPASPLPPRPASLCLMSPSRWSLCLRLSWKTSPRRSPR